VKGRFRRLRAMETKLGKLLTGLGTRCGDGLVAAWISAVNLVSFDAATDAWVEARALRGSGRYIKG